MPIDSCTCQACVSACKRVPGIFHPVEALRAIRAGHADDIMSRWEDDGSRSAKLREQWRVLMPMSHSPSSIRTDNFDPRRRTGSWDSVGRCVFLNPDDRCEIHESNFKPIECRGSLACGPHDKTHEIAVAAWRGVVGRFVLDLWKRELERVGL